MRKIVISVMISLLLASCASSKRTTTSKINETSAFASSSSAIIKNVISKESSFDYLMIKSTLKADLGDINTGIDATIFIDNQDKIWINAQKFIFKARALVTPDKFQAYENMGKSYIDGDFSFINKILGVDFIDYQKFQNLMLGKVFVNLTDTDFIAEKVDNEYRITPTAAKSKKEAYEQSYIFDSGFRLKEANLHYPKEKVEVQIQYLNWVKAGKEELPKNVKILVKDKKTKQIDLEYNSFTFQQIDTPFSIPSGYKKRDIK
ncbi:DUF4292 domain-containing protein [Weeksella virosa]|uniref:Deoxyuridine 5'-triphosphate nucleotidohydrolase n=1 Tax=Weeksella virosa (strain ATCC 43766 / DSM 16922 / JCM 21250 / CCUG 30538 / CDC 9751 / IAM 14551 / NBRC 16016 / NCTC 11634 / CL345/78) TaxID=865938 RepID=F0P2L8_WEEVC|nr:DUF4292 domain-containing protein [Weeksella virosa]ADX67857.1 hypothetical protein Weevi_1148 [Weeksella virosa DSM 16922]MDK7674458.1 DUF4292 domain-containing protein [Weeksella virosa]SUP54160.1 Uncharacterised protein [Weeksella virosa]VEH64516.1 Uncharacterised protein [Weeksella virosa]